jgi:hypothetical protein
MKIRCGLHGWAEVADFSAMDGRFSAGHLLSTTFLALGEVWLGPGPGLRFKLNAWKWPATVTTTAERKFQKATGLSTGCLICAACNPRVYNVLFVFLCCGEREMEDAAPYFMTRGPLI